MYAISLTAESGFELVFLHALQNGWPPGEEEREFRDPINSTVGATVSCFARGPAGRPGYPHHCRGEGVDF